MAGLVILFLALPRQVSSCKCVELWISFDFGRERSVELPKLPDFPSSSIIGIRNLLVPGFKGHCCCRVVAQHCELRPGKESSEQSRNQKKKNNLRSLKIIKERHQEIESSIFWRFGFARCFLAGPGCEVWPISRGLTLCQAGSTFEPQLLEQKLMWNHRIQQHSFTSWFNHVHRRLIFAVI